MKSKLILLLKLSFVIGLLWFLAKKGFLSLDATRGAFRHPELLGPAFLLMCLAMVLGVYRWKWLLSAQEIHLSFAKTLQLTLIGNFFNIALPGAVSGDFVKAYYIGDQVREKRAPAFGAILFDRVLGVSALVLVAAGALILGLQQFLGTALMGGVRFSLMLSGACVILFYGYLFLVRESYDPVLILLRSLEGKFEKAGSIVRIYEGIRAYHTERVLVMKALLISLVIHISVATACLLFSHAVGDPAIGLPGYFVVVPLGLLVTAVPVMPGGVGTGHAAFGYLFHLLGLVRGADIFSLFLLVQLIIAGVGGLVYLKYKGAHPAPTLQ